MVSLPLIQEVDTSLFVTAKGLGSHGHSQRTHKYMCVTEQEVWPV